MNYPIQRFINIRLAYMPSFSADGRYLSFISNITGQPQVWRINLTAAKEQIPWPEQLTFSTGRVMTAQYSPVPGDNRLFFAQDVGGNENAQLYVLQTDGQERCLTAGYENCLHIPSEWSADGSQILFGANRRNRALFDLYSQPVNGCEAQLIWEHDQPGFLINACWSPAMDRVALVRMKGSAEYDLLEIEVDSGKARQLNPLGNPTQFRKIAYSQDGRSLYANTNLDADFMYIARLDLATERWQKLAAPNWDTEHMALSPDGRYLAYGINEAGASRLELLDLTTGVTRPVPQQCNIPGVVGWYDMQLTFSSDSRSLAYSLTSATSTADIHVWELGADRSWPVTASSHGGVPGDQFVIPELVHYETFDGRHIPAWFYRPEDPGREEGSAGQPVIVWVHGGPESQYRPYFNFLVQYFANHGYAILAPNVRGSTGYGKAYSALDDVDKRMDAVADLAHAAHWLKNQPGINPNQIAVYGGSYGGFMVLSALTTYPDLWAAGVNIVGISNFVTFLENTSSYRRAHRETEYGSLAHHRAFLEEISPMNHLEEIKAPLMVIHGANDPRVPLSEAEQLVENLNQRGIPVKFLVFDDEGHGLTKLKNKLIAYPEIVRFLDGILRR